jgi:uncharacterized membrane protein
MVSSKSSKEQGHPAGIERVVFFSDAVMAIAITLLAIDIRVPEAASMTGESLLSHLSNLSPQITSFVISFTVIGIYWAAHNRYFALIRRSDGRLIGLNMLFLFFVASMPFVSSLLGHYPDLPAGIVPYAFDVAALGLSMAAIWTYATAGHRLVDADLDPTTIHLLRIRPMATSAVFLISIPVAAWHPRLGTWFWLLAPIVVALMPRFLRPAAAQSEDE